MPDFSTEAVHAFWSQRHDSILYRIIASMESVEDWVFDGDPDVEDAILRLSECFEDFDNFELAEEDKIIRILSHLKSGRALRILQYMDSILPGSASKLLIFAEVASKEENDAAGFFLNRNLVFERMQLLSRIFATDRVSMVKKVLDIDAV